MKINVNSTQMETDKTTLTYQDIIELAGEKYYPGMVRSITYQRAPLLTKYSGKTSKTEGILCHGQEVAVADGLRLNCYDTSNA
jgi:hypothetical protein